MSKHAYFEVKQEAEVTEALDKLIGELSLRYFQQHGVQYVLTTAFSQLSTR